MLSVITGFGGGHCSDAHGRGEAIADSLWSGIESEGSALAMVAGSVLVIGTFGAETVCGVVGSEFWPLTPAIDADESGAVVG
jgi:hypothetical protein